MSACSLPAILATLLISALSTCVSLPQSAATVTSVTRLAIMQGVTGTDYTQVLVLTQGEHGYRIVLVDKQGKERAAAVYDVSRRADSHWRMQRAVFTGLAPRSTYRLRVYQHGKLLDVRQLRTLDPRRRTLRVAVASCMDDHIAQGDIWQQMLALRPDVVFLIGDNSYADKYIKGIEIATSSKHKRVVATPAELWQRHVETRSYIDLFKSKMLVPVVATWDDHDYGINNGGSNYPYKKESLTIFKAFFASQPSAHYQPAGIGNAAFFTMYGFNFFLLDNRSFRAAYDKAGDHYGKKQLHWLWRNLRGKDDAFLVGGDQFFGGYHRFDSFEGSHRVAFTRFLTKLKRLETKVAFISGDRHITEIMRIAPAELGYQTYEFTSSPIHGKLYPGNWDKTPNPRQIASHDMQHNFMLLELSRRADELRIQAASHGKGGDQFFRGDYALR